MSQTNADERLESFQTEVDKLGITGGLANPERAASNIGVLMLVVGGFFALIWSFTKRGNPAIQEETKSMLAEIVHANNNVWIGLFGIALILIGMALWLRNSMTRYLRYWLTRVIFEERANTDRLIEALRDR